METALYFEKYLSVWQEETEAIFENHDNMLELSYFMEATDTKKSLGVKIREKIGQIFQACRNAIDKLIAKITGKKEAQVDTSVKMEKIKLEKQYQYNKAILQRIRGAKTMKELEDIQKDIKRGKFIKIAAVSVSAAAILGGARFLKKTKERNKQMETEIAKLSADIEKEKKAHGETKVKLRRSEAEVGIAQSDASFYKTKADINAADLKKEKKKLEDTVAKYEDMIATLKREQADAEKSLKQQMRQQKSKINEDNHMEKLKTKADFEKRYNEGIQKTRDAYVKRMDKLQEAKQAAEEKTISLERELRNTKQDLAATKKSAEIDHDAALAGFGHRMENDKLRSELKVQKNLAADGWAARDKLYDEKMKLTAQIAGMVSKNDVDACREIVEKHDMIQGIIERQQLKYRSTSTNGDNKYAFDASTKGRKAKRESLKEMERASSKSIARHFTSLEQLDGEVDRLRNKRRSIEQRIKNGKATNLDDLSMEKLQNEKKRIEASYNALRNARYDIYKKTR